MTSIAEVREFYAVPRDLWGSFVQAAGDPGEDLKLLAALPTTVRGPSLPRDNLSPQFKLPMWVGLQLGAEDHLHEGWWRLGQVAGPVPFLGSTTSSWQRRSECPAGEGRYTWGAQAEDDPGDRSVRRWRICGTVRRGSGKVVRPPEEEDPTSEQVSALDKRIHTQDISPCNL